LFCFFERGAPLCPVAVPEKIGGLSLPLIFSTAATPFCSLYLPPAAVANVPTSIRLRIYKPDCSDSLLFCFFRTGSPVMPCCGARKNRRACAFLDFFDRGHSFLLPLSAVCSGRKRPHFDTSPYI